MDDGETYNNGEVLRQLLKLRDDFGEWQANANAWRESTPQRFVLREEFDARLSAIQMEVLRQVTGTTQAMVTDAIHSALQEDFATMFAQAFKDARASERKERVKDFKDALGWPMRVSQYLLPPLTLISSVLGLWWVVGRLW